MMWMSIQSMQEATKLGKKTLEGQLEMLRQATLLD
jgi:hypothetical protein